MMSSVRYSADRTELRLTLPDRPDAWDPSGPEEVPTARLSLVPFLIINGCYFRCEAYAVEDK